MLRWTLHRIRFEGKVAAYLLGSEILPTYFPVNSINDPLVAVHVSQWVLQSAVPDLMLYSVLILAFFMY